MIPVVARLAMLQSTLLVLRGECMFYLFNKNGSCIVSSEYPLEANENNQLIISDIEYNPWEIELVDGIIQKKVIPEPEEPPLVVEDEYVIDERSVDILSAIAELSEAILELQGGNDL